MKKGTAPVFIGPKSCGKSTTLRQVHHAMKSAHKVTFLDLKATSTSTVLSQVPEETFIFIDNAQMLGKNDDLAKAVREQLVRGQGACYAFSPLLVSPHGNSIVSADIQRLYKTYYFTPFSEAELTQYLNAKFPKNTQPELLREHLKLTENIPFLVEGVVQNYPHTKDDVQAWLDRHIRYQLQTLEINLKSENLATRSAAIDVQNALLSAAALGCGSLTHSQKNLLLESGLCYPKTQTSRQEIRLTYPKEMLLASLKAYVRHTAHLLSQFDKGAGLEFVFCMTASIGFVLEGINTNKTTLQIPPATEVWVQPSYGSIPTDFGNSYQHCLLVKLAENHVAVDFLLVDCTSGGVQGRKLYFVQVSVQAYESRHAERRCSAIEKSSPQLGNSPPTTFYSSKFNVKGNKCYYVYVSSATSSFASVTKREEKEKVYSLLLNYELTYLK